MPILKTLWQGPKQFEFPGDTEILILPVKESRNRVGSDVPDGVSGFVFSCIAAFEENFSRN